MSCNEWQKVKLGEVADILSGYAFKTKDFIDEGIPVVKIKNIIPPNIDINDTQYVSNELYNEKIKFALNYNDVLISLNGSNINQLASAVGKIGRVRLKDKKLLLNQRVGKLYIVDEKRCNYDYLYYYLTQPEVRYNLAAMAGGSANQANISPSQIKDIEIQLPPLEEQEKIANILSSLDDKIELNNEMNKTLEEMAQSIFKRWFIDFEFPNEDGQPYKSSGGEMVESELGMIPKEWEIAQIDDISQVTMGVSPSSKTYNEDNIGLPLLNGAADFEGKLIKPSKFTSEPKKICKKGDMVFGVRATIGNIVFADKEYALGRGVASVEPNDKVFREFIYYSLDNSMENLINNASGSVFLNLKKADITDLKVCYSDEIVKKFNNISRVLIDKIVENDMESELLKQQRDILLPKLVSGEIRITN